MKDYTYYSELVQLIEEIKSQGKQLPTILDLIPNSTPVPAEIAKVVNENFWDLIEAKPTKMIKDHSKVIKDRLNALKSELKQLTTPKLTKRINEGRVLELRLRINELYWVLDKLRNA